MKALVCRAVADDVTSARVEEVALPGPGPKEVRIAVRAAAANFPDVLMIRGRYHRKPGLPFVVGGECAGEVVEAGPEVRRWKPGDRVVGGAFTGGFAEQRVLPETSLRRVPDTAGFATAACFTTAYLTAYVSLVRRGALQRGETLLVHGASGGVGLAAVDLGRLLGARVIATASRREKRAFLEQYGAAHVLPSSGFREAVKELTGGAGADVIYDPVGGDVFDESVRCVAFGGRLLVVGFAAGRIPSIPVNLPLIKGFSVVGVRAGEYGRRFPGRGRENLAAIDALLARGEIHPHIHARFPLARATEALQMLTTRRVIGKVVVEP
ncbi:MAG TPA: NADPH:quinone oxidoreductase family protein [Gammaproteobacteria bacterium]|nr:NADPH:quinone oxidoreductase family protein [Gammaproteobacteria bacterium]